MTGKKLQFSDHYQCKLKDLVQDKMCREYSLEIMDWRKATKEKRKAEKEGSTKYAKTVAEQRIRNRGGESWKDELREIIDSAKEEADTRDELENLLAEQGVMLSRSTSKTITYVFGTHPAVRGNRLGEKYTVEAIATALEKNRAAQRSGLDTLIEEVKGRGTTQVAAGGKRQACVR